MAQPQPALYGFNAGEVDDRAIARVDLERLRLAGASIVNWLLTIIGEMSLRPGFEYMGELTLASDQKARLLPFIETGSTGAAVLVTDQSVRIWNDRSGEEVQLGTSNVTLNATWTEEGDDPPAGETYTRVVDGGLFFYGLEERETALQNVFAVTDEEEVSLRIVVDQGPVNFRIGTTPDGDDVWPSDNLLRGVHYITFIPESTGMVYLRIRHEGAGLRVVSAVTVAAAGSLDLQGPWLSDDLALIDYEQSADRLYITCNGYQPRQLERRNARSWSLTYYEPTNGPYGPSRRQQVRIRRALEASPIADRRGVLIEASRSRFQPGQIGSLLRLSHQGQDIVQELRGGGQSSRSIRVTGVGTTRRFIVSVTATGNTTGTPQLQRSIGNEFNFQNFRAITVNQTVPAIDDELDNQIVYYRVATPDDFTGRIDVSLTYAQGLIDTIGRVVRYISPTQIEIDLIDRDLSTFEFTEEYQFSDWSDGAGWPDVVSFADGRLILARRDFFYGSVSDDFTNFDPDFEGDAAPVLRSLGRGPREGINWIGPLTRLALGTAAYETSVATTTLDEPLSPMNFSFRTISSRGCAQVRPAIIDNALIFTQSGAQRCYEVIYQSDAYNFVTQELTAVNRQITESRVQQMAVQRRPETVCWMELGNGQLAGVLYERDEQVKGWFRVSTAGQVIAHTTLPGSDEDRLWAVVRRASGVSIERMALISQAQGGMMNMIADSYSTYRGRGDRADAAAGAVHRTLSSRSGRTVKRCSMTTAVICAPTARDLSCCRSRRHMWSGACPISRDGKARSSPMVQSAARA